MSFNTWDDELTTLDMPPHRQREAAFKAGYAEAEAQIAALKSQLNESEMHRHELMERLQDRCDEIAALQLERDALKQRIEQLEVQMAGITTVALGWGIKESEILEKGAWAWSVPYQDVLDLRRKYDALQEALRLGVEWNDDYMKINNLYGTVDWVEHSRKLLSIPASGEPARKP